MASVDRLNSKIAAQTRELQTHEVQISGYERELTRVWFFSVKS